MYAVIRRYGPGTGIFDVVTTREQEVREIISGVPGFVAYYVVRSGTVDASITICQDQSGTTESTRRAADWVRQNVPAAVGSPPEIIEGEVGLSFTS
jgi:hypothetical protein